HLRRAEMEIAHDVGPGDRDADAVEIRDGAQRHRHRQHLVADTRRGGAGLEGQRAGRIGSPPIDCQCYIPRGMTTSPPKVLITESEYRKAEPRFLSAPGLECLCAPDFEADLAAAVRDAQASHVVVGAKLYAGALYDSLQAGSVIARFGVGHDGIDKARATRAGLLCTNTPGVLNQ